MFFGVCLMFEQCPIEKKQPGSDRGWLWVWQIFKLLTPSLWFIIRRRLSFSRLCHSQCQLQPSGLFFCLYLTSELCLASAAIDWARNSQALKEGDFGSDRDSNRWPPPHDFSSGGDSVYHHSVSPSINFRSNYFTICRPSPMLMQQMPTPEHEDSRQFLNIHVNYRYSLTDAEITWHATVTAKFSYSSIWCLFTYI